MQKLNKSKLSVVVPALNEDKIIQNTNLQITTVLKNMIKSSLIKDYEIIFVDDGSTDKTWELIKHLHIKNIKVIGIKFSRNFGIQAAYTAGLSQSSGNYIVMIDCDLQDPPKLIEKMFIKLIDTKSDVVYGKRSKRSEKIYKRLAIKLFHFIFHATSSINAPQDVGNFSIMNRRAVEALLSFKEKNKYLPGLRYLIGFKQTHISYHRHDRKDGQANMNISKLFRLASDALFSFTDFPLKFCLYIGLIGALLSLLIGSYALITRLLNYNVTTGWSSILLSIYFFGSVQLIFLGIIGEYIYKIYTEVQKRPSYFISELIK